MSKKSLVPLRKVNRELKQFRLIGSKAVIGGVCAGVAYRLGVPTWLVRLVWGGIAFFAGAGIVLYIAVWAIAPEASETPADYAERTGD